MVRFNGEHCLRPFECFSPIFSSTVVENFSFMFAIVRGKLNRIISLVERIAYLPKATTQRTTKALPCLGPERSLTLIRNSWKLSDCSEWADKSVNASDTFLASSVLRYPRRSIRDEIFWSFSKALSSSNPAYRGRRLFAARRGEDGIRRVPGECQEGVRRVPGECQESVRRVSGECHSQRGGGRWHQESVSRGHEGLDIHLHKQRPCV